MNKPQFFLSAALLGGALALTGCVTQPAQSTTTAASTNAPATSTVATLASATGTVLGNVLQAHGGAAGLMSSLGVPASSTPSNAAGVLAYCAKNNYLNADKAGSLATQLLSSLGLPTATDTANATTQDAGYAQGIAGMIIAPNGTLFSLDQIKSNVKDKACEFVMTSAASFLPQ